MSFPWLDVGPLLALPGFTIYYVVNLKFFFSEKEKKKRILFTAAQLIAVNQNLFTSLYKATWDSGDPCIKKRIMQIEGGKYVV